MTAWRRSVVENGNGPNQVTEDEVVKALRRVVERPEHLVVNCWRSVREVALLLGGNLTSEALLANPNSPMLKIKVVSSEDKCGIIRNALNFEEYAFINPPP